MTGFIKLKGKIREIPIQVSDELARQIKKIKFGDGYNPPCESSKLLDLGEVFAGTYGDIANVWIEADHKQEMLIIAPLTEEERENAKRRFAEMREQLPWLKKEERPKMTPEEMKQTEEELKQFSVTGELQAIKESNNL